MPTEPDIFRDPWFRCICIVGFAVNRHRNDIFQQTDEEQSRSWLEAVEIIQNECQSARNKGVEEDEDYLIERTKRQLTETAKTFHKENPGLERVLRKIAADIRPLTDTQIMDEFLVLQTSGYKIAHACATTWGGPRAKARLSVMKKGSLVFDDFEESGPQTIVPTWTDTDNALIHVALGGGKTPLFGLLCLEFYLFHEFLSHLFPVWEDSAGKLSEGYLFRIARWWYLTSEDVPITSALVEVDWANHWHHQQVKQDSDYWNRFHMRSDWFEARLSRERFSWLILEIAAFPKDVRNGFQRRFMGLLYSVYKQRDSLGLGILSRVTGFRIEDIHDKLLRHVRSTVPAKIKKILGL
jgi:hypothetical protein